MPLHLNAVTNAMRLKLPSDNARRSLGKNQETLRPYCDVAMLEQALIYKTALTMGLSLEAPAAVVTLAEQTNLSAQLTQKYSDYVAQGWNFGEGFTAQGAPARLVELARAVAVHTLHPVANKDIALPQTGDRTGFSR